MTRAFLLPLSLLTALLFACSRPNPGPGTTGQSPPPPSEPSVPASVGTVAAPIATTAAPVATRTAENAFERFLLTASETPCPPEARGDCDSMAELLADGTLRMNPWGAPQTQTLRAQVPPTKLAAALARLTDPGLMALLGQAKVCATANDTEHMLVRLGRSDHQNQTGYCNQDAVQAARAAIMELTQEQFPNHSLISRPF